jgi:hypothetical protein
MNRMKLEVYFMKMQNPNDTGSLFWDDRTWQVLPHPPDNPQSDNQIEVFQLGLFHSKNALEGV